METATTGLRRSKRILLTAGILGSAVTMAGLGSYASFTSSTSVAQGPAATGTLVANLGATGSVSNRLNLGANVLAPGDTMQRSVDLINGGTLDYSAVVLTTAAPTSSLLDTDASNGLQMVVDRCSVPWTESGVSPAFTYTCGGTTSSVLASRPVVGANLALSNLGSLTAGATDHLRVTLTLPSSADNSFQGRTSSLTYTFVATQRAATGK